MIRDMWEDTNLNLDFDLNAKYAIWGSDDEAISIFIKLFVKGYRIVAFVDKDVRWSEKKVKKKYPIQIWDLQLLREHSDVVLVSEENVQIEELCANRVIFWEKRKIREQIKLASAVYIYGSGASGTRTRIMLENLGIDVKGFIDSSPLKWGASVQGKRIYKPEVIKDQDAVTIISTMYFEEIYEKLPVECQKNIFVDDANSKYWSKIPLFDSPLIDIKGCNCLQKCDDDSLRGSM